MYGWQNVYVYEYWIAWYFISVSWPAQQLKWTLHIGTDLIDLPLHIAAYISTNFYLKPKRYLSDNIRPDCPGVFHGPVLGRAFFKNIELLGLGRHFGWKLFEAFGVFSAGLWVPIWVLWVPCPCFPLFNHYFYKISFYIQFPNKYLGVGFEFGPQRIWDLAFLCQ